MKRIVLLLVIIAVSMGVSGCGNDLYGSWCEDSVGNGKPGMAAYIFDDEIIVYHVADNGLNRTPYWIGSYEKHDDDSFSWESVKNKEKAAECIFMSDDDTKTFTYENGTLSFASSIGSSSGEKHLKKTGLNFSTDYHNVNEGLQPTDVDYSGLHCTVPISFGAYVDGDNLKRFVSGDSLLLINRYPYDEYGISDEQFDEFYKASNESFVTGVKDMFSNVDSIESNETTIGNKPGMKAKIDGSYKDVKDATLHVAAVYVNEQDNCMFFTLTMFVSNGTSHDYESDFNAIIDSITIDSKTDSASSEDIQKTVFAEYMHMITASDSPEMDPNASSQTVKDFEDSCKEELAGKYGLSVTEVDNICATGITKDWSY